MMGDMDREGGYREAWAEGFAQASPEAIRVAASLADAATRMMAAHASGGADGRVAAVPVLQHHCAPGWRTETRGDGGRYGIPPMLSDYPAGTVWECICGRRWISREKRSSWVNLVDWRPERWWKRRRRMRKEAGRG